MSLITYYIQKPSIYDTQASSCLQSP